MNYTNFIKYAVDNSSILYLTLVRRDHTNVYRFTMTLTEEIEPDILQRALDRIHHRFPTIFAGFVPEFFRYVQITAKETPKVQPDPGPLLTMTKQELRTCACRIYYKGNTVTLEAFHAVTDGYGAITAFTTLVAQYLQFRYDIPIPVSAPIVAPDSAPSPDELEDSYLRHGTGKAIHLPSRYSYQLPGGNASREHITLTTIQVPSPVCLIAARNHGTSVTGLISTLLAKSIMEIQTKENNRSNKPVRIMVPLDLRRMFPSKTLRNFILYVLPTMEVQDHRRPLSDLIHNFSRQIQEQIDPDRLRSIMAYNVKTQNAWYFKCLPIRMKCAVMRLAYRYFGESNSSITLTNLGNVTLPPEMSAHVTGFDVYLTPRVRSPYNATIISYNGTLSISFSRFPMISDLETIFREKLTAVINNKEVET